MLFGLELNLYYNFFHDLNTEAEKSMEIDIKLAVVCRKDFPFFRAAM